MRRIEDPELKALQASVIVLTDVVTSLDNDILIPCYKTL